MIWNIGPFLGPADSEPPAEIPVYLGDVQIEAVYIGSTEIAAIYLWSTEIYSKE